MPSRPADFKVRKKFDRLRSAEQGRADPHRQRPRAWFVVPGADDQLRAVRTTEAVLDALRKPRSPRPGRLHVPQSAGRQRI